MCCKKIFSFTALCFLFITANADNSKVELLKKQVELFSSKHNYDSAQAKVLEFLEQKNLSETELFYGYFLFGEVIKSAGKPESAVDLFLKSKNFLQNISGKKKHESLVYGSIAECFFDMQMYEEAEKYAGLSIETSPDSSLRKGGHAINNLIIGYKNFLDKKYPAALDLYNKAMNEFTSSGNRCELPLCYMKIAKVQNAQGNFQQAEETINHSIRISDSCGIEKYKLLSKYSLFDIYKANKNYEKAMNVMLEINSLVEKIQKSEQQQQMHDLEARYNMQLLKTQNENLQQINLKKEEALSAKKKEIYISIVVIFILCALVIVLLNIFRKKNMLEGKLAGINSTLEQKVKQRTSELEKSELRYRELYQSQEKVLVDYFNLISNLDEGFFAVDATNNFSPIIISNTFAGLYGFPVNDFYNNSNLWFEQIYPDDKKIVLDKMNALYKGIPTFEEHRIIRKDGSVMWVSGKVTPTLDENKKLVRLDGVISDITARKNAEEKLKEEEANLKSIIENTDANIYSIDRNFRYISFNSNLKNAVKNAFGVEIKKGDNTFSIYEKINPAEAKWWEEIYSSIFKRKEPASFVKDYSTENIPMFFHFSISPIWENKEVVGLSCFSRNITGKILSEKKIDELTQRLLLATNSAHIGIFDWDISSNKLTWDKNMYLLYGVSPDEKENPQVIASNKLHPDDLPILTIKVKEAMQTGFFHEEFRIIWSNGEIHYTEAHAIIQKDEKGNIRMIGVNCDITEQKLSEEKLKISEAQVRKLAQHLNNVLEEERARIAREIHDELGQQLAGIKMGLFSLKKNAGNIELTEKRINEIVSDAENAIRSMRKISTQLRPGILDTLGLVPSISWIAQEFEKKSGIKCDLKINSNEAPLNSETSICFYRICQEAFTNISKHSGASSVKVEVEQTEKVFSLKISDNGKGFDNSKLENPFSIGLLGMRERAKNINASLEIESQPNNGTSICAVLILNQIK